MVLKLKSVEFLSLLSLLLIIYSLIYSYFREIEKASFEKLESFKEEVEAASLSSLISSMCWYGAPFSYERTLPQVEIEAPCKVEFDPILRIYRYETCRRI